MSAAYTALEKRFRRLGALAGAEATLHWDTAVMMPPGGQAARSEQLAALRLLQHELLTAPELADLLDVAEAEAESLDAWRRANLRGMQRRRRHAAALPPELVEARSKTNADCEFRWRDARAADDFASLRAPLQAVVGLAREAAAAKAAAFGTSPYDALLDGYEPGLTDAAIKPLFAELAERLPALLQAALQRQAKHATTGPQGPFEIAAQQALAKRIAVALGFDMNAGRVDTSHHPFTGGTPDDVRLTTRYRADDFVEALMGLIHETGHALYEQGLPREWRLQPVGRSMGMAVHESQSLLVEMQLGRSAAFCRFLAPLLGAAFGASADRDGEALARRLTRVERSLIRVDADEVTYPLHVILRWRLEKALLAGDLAVADLPAAWSDGMQALIGVRPPDDRDGCMQDVHWYGGDFGYFPTYTLGALAAAQLFAAARRALPELERDVEAGAFAPLVGWLRENVHRWGSLFESADVLLERAAGTPLSTAPFLAHLEQRYLAR